MDIVKNAFRGELAYLSNFYHCRVQHEGIDYMSSEHAYQAAKTIVPDDRAMIVRTRTASGAKRMGKYVTMREGWGDMKIPIMRQIVLSKFTINEGLRNLLLWTRDKPLVEYNSWGDTFWGVSHGKGSNNLGKILMSVRDELSEKHLRSLM